MALGGVVTTFRVGMADPVWPTYPWHLLLDLVGRAESRLRRRTHAPAGRLRRRLLRDRAGGRPVVRPGRDGWLWLARRRCWPWSPRACSAASACLLNAPAGPELAAVHGVFAQVVFSLLVCLAVLTSPRRVPEFRRAGIRAAAVCRTRAGPGGAGLPAARLGRVVRHLHDPRPLRLHVLTAFAVVGRRSSGWCERHGNEPAGRRVLGRTAGRAGRSARFAGRARRRGLAGSVRRRRCRRSCSRSRSARPWSAPATSSSAPASWPRRSSPPCRRTGRPCRRAEPEPRAGAGGRSRLRRPSSQQVKGTA